MNPAIVCGHVHPITREVVWQEFPFAHTLEEVPVQSVFQADIVYQRHRDGSIKLAKHRIRSTDADITEDQLRQDLSERAASLKSNPEQLALSLPLNDLPGSLWDGVDPMSGMHSAWLQQRSKEEI